VRGEATIWRRAAVAARRLRAVRERRVAQLSRERGQQERPSGPRRVVVAYSRRAFRALWSCGRGWIGVMESRRSSASEAPRGSVPDAVRLRCIQVSNSRSASPISSHGFPHLISGDIPGRSRTFF
jgi:hypothetical protein